MVNRARESAMMRRLKHYKRDWHEACRAPFVTLYVESHPGTLL